MHNAHCGPRTATFLVAAILLSAQAPTRLGAQERTIPMAADGYLRVFNRTGAIRVTGWGVDSVHWVARLAPGQELFGGGTGQMAKVGVTGPTGPATLEIQVPRGIKLVVDGGDGMVEIAGVTGPIEIQGGSGAVQVTGAPVRLTIGTVDGTVTLLGGPYRSTEVRTGGGTIRATGARGEVILSSVTGAIFAEVDSVTRGGITTVAGMIRVGGSVDPTGTLTIESHGGDIQLQLGPRPGIEVVATAFGGTIENRLSAARPRTVRDGRGQQLETLIGTGGGTVTVTSFKGRVRLEPKPGSNP